MPLSRHACRVLRPAELLALRKLSRTCRAESKTPARLALERPIGRLVRLPSRRESKSGAAPYAGLPRAMSKPTRTAVRFGSDSVLRLDAGVYLGEFPSPHSVAVLPA